MKKIFSVIFAFSLIAAGFLYRTAKTACAEEISGSAKASYLMDYDSGTVISARNENARLTIASMCKIMTLVIIFDEINAGNLTMDQTLTISPTAAGMGGSQAFLEAGAQYKVSELIKSIVIASANDSCMAFAEQICGSEKTFTERMNKRAREMGMGNTLFSNCTGLPKPTQYSCAKDVAKMFCELIKNEEYFGFSKIWMSDLEHPKGRVTGLTNTNKLIRFYEGCDGGKTGFTSESGHCLTATAKRGSMRLISVVIGAPDSKSRFKEVSDMFNYGFANFTNKMIVDSATPLSVTAKVSGGKREEVEIIPEKNYYAFGRKNETEDYRIEFNPAEKVKAPLKKGDAVGELTVYRDGVEVARINCLSYCDVDKKTYFGYIADVMKEWAM